MRLFETILINLVDNIIGLERNHLLKTKLNQVGTL